MRPTTLRAVVCFCLLRSVALLQAGSVPGDENWDAGFNVPDGLNGDVTSAVSLGNDLYVAGHFTRAGTIEVKSFARWDGKHWLSAGPGVSGEIFVMTVLGADLFAGGSFVTEGPVRATNVAKWNGKQWEALGTGIPSYETNQFGSLPQFVFALAPGPNGD